MKTCNKCGIEKELHCFGKNKAMKDGLHSSCKECINSINKAFAEANPKAKKEYSRKWIQNNKEKHSANNKQWIQNNRDKSSEYSKKWQDKNKEAVVAYRKEYKLNNRASCTALENKRRASKLLRTPNWLTEEHLEQIRTEYKLASWCTKVMGEPYEVDHIVPLQGKNVSGLHVPWNLQVISKVDNARKNNKWQS